MIARIDLQDAANSFPSEPDNCSYRGCHLESDACVPFFAISVCCPQYIVLTPVSMLSLPILHH